MTQPGGWTQSEALKEPAKELQVWKELGYLPWPFATPYRKEQTEPRARRSRSARAGGPMQRRLQNAGPKSVKGQQMTL